MKGQYYQKKKNQASMGGYPCKTRADVDRYKTEYGDLTIHLI